MERQRRLPVLGVDVGGVIIGRVAEGSDTSFFGPQPLLTPAVDGVMEALAALTAEPFAGRVHVISKAGPRVADRTREWLGHHDFFARTGIPDGHLHFVRERADKAPVCARLGVTHFVDDRLDVLAHLTTVAHRLLFTGGLGDLTPPDPGAVPSWATVTGSWPEVVAAVRSTR
ncbi:hypothetical protein [Streptomyces sp. NPDC048172]|uniref:hypothetical protein n=1 Tax=Streptomyces sp. NPDC048172 TaxID=3365505 RepID=UPI0037179D9D